MSTFRPFRRPAAPAAVVVFAAILYLAAAPPARSQGITESSGIEALREAREFIESGRFLEAAGFLQELAELTPSDEIRARARKLAGDVLSYWLEKSRAGLSAYLEALKGPLDANERSAARFNVGMLYYEERDFAHAAQAMEMYLREFPTGLRAPTARFILELAKRKAGEKEAPPPEVEREKPRVALETDPEIRVRVLKGTRSAEVASDAPMKIRILKLASEFRLGAAVRVEVRSGRLHVLRRAIGGDAAEIRPTQGTIRLNGRAYRGRLTVRVEDGRLLVVNTLKLENYLRAVVPKEMIASWPIEALKAQAVAARTYALYQHRKRTDYLYDVDATILSQVYGGKRTERPKTDRAVSETRGKVLLKGDRLVLAYFHANSGGFTEDSGNVWRVSFPYLQSKADPYSRRKKSAWAYGLSLAELSRRLKRRGIRVGRVSRVIPLERTASGRIKAFRVVGSRGTRKLSGNTFRIGVGSTRMQSTLVQFREGGEGGRLKMEGRGLGHGVGMSQWGANEMARRGLSHQEILSFYYPGTRLTSR